MNIYLGKMGKSVLFNRDAWGPIGGDNEAPIYFENLFHRNPDINFYLFGANDFSRIKSTDRLLINKHNNVHDVWGWGWDEYLKTHEKDSFAQMNYLAEWVKTGPKMDCGIVFAGPTGSSNVLGKTTLMKNPSELASPLEMLCKYCAPMMQYMNEYKVPYSLILNDPRFYPPHAKDWMHLPEYILSQYDEDMTVKVRKSYNDNTIIEHKRKARYEGVETTFLINNVDDEEPLAGGLDAFFASSDEEPQDEKNINFMIVLNEGRPSRYNLLEKTILRDIDDVAIYGKWDPRTVGDDPRFKGSLPFLELQKKLKSVKYTYCIPIKKGWCTAKFWEMTHNGIIPFLHPSYDEQNHLKAPDILRVGDSKELFKRIKFLEDHPEAYDTLRNNLAGMCKDEYYSGQYLNDRALHYIKLMTNQNG